MDPAAAICYAFIAAVVVTSSCYCYSQTELISVDADVE